MIIKIGLSRNFSSSKLNVKITKMKRITLTNVPIALEKSEKNAKPLRRLIVEEKIKATTILPYVPNLMPFFNKKTRYKRSNNNIMALNNVYVMISLSKK